MNGSTEKNDEHCLEMLRRFASRSDGDAAGWLVDNDALVGEVLIGHLDRLTAVERLDVYSTLFGFFRQHYKRVVHVRLQVEQDPKCRERLTTIEELHREAFQEPYSPTTDDELIAGTEKNLLHDDARVRYLGAFGLWLLTKNPRKVIPTLLAILKNRGGEARIEAATLLGEVRPFDEDTIQTLREIARDPGDPVRLVAEESLRQCQRSIQASDGGLGEGRAH